MQQHDLSHGSRSFIYSFNDTCLLGVSTTTISIGAFDWSATLLANESNWGERGLFNKAASSSRRWSPLLAPNHSIVFLVPLIFLRRRLYYEWSGKDPHQKASHSGADAKNRARILRSQGRRRAQCSVWRRQHSVSGIDRVNKTQAARAGN